MEKTSVPPATLLRTLMNARDWLVERSREEGGNDTYIAQSWAFGWVANYLVGDMSEADLYKSLGLHEQYWRYLQEQERRKDILETNLFMLELDKLSKEE